MTPHSTLTPSALAGLEEKLAKATGPDREIDARMHVLIVGQGGFRSELRHSIFSQNIDEWTRTGDIAKVADNYGIPAYTGSIDSAIALVERVLPDVAVEINTGDPTLKYGQPKARLLPYNGPDAPWLWWPSSGIEGRAPTPAIALCLALIRALAAQQGERGC